jgi:DNA-binding response OmpR family regulator
MADKQLPGSGSMKKKVLVADDNKMVHELYQACFGDEFDLVHAYDGAETLMLAADLIPDLILLDIMMPLLDGRSICKQLKKHPRTKNIIVIMVTAKDSQADRLVGFEVGADDYVEKHCLPDFLLSRIRKHLR